MFFEALSAVRDIGRLQHLASILIRYGFGDIVRRMGLVDFLARTGKVLNWKYAQEQSHLELPERVRRAMEEMGPTFIKFGQILATRVDLFPPEWIEEFEKLHDRVPPLPFKAVRQQLEEDLGLPINEVFKYFEEKPLAGASIAQVHRACLQDGMEVAVKIRRPAIRKTIDADLRLLERLAKIAESEIAEMKHYRPRDVIHQFTQSLYRELDLAAECRNAERMAGYFEDDPNIVIPNVYWEWVSERVNIQQYIDGFSSRNFTLMEQAGLDRKKLAVNGTQAVLKMVLVAGLFHADPHPGNILFLPNNRIAFIDFGMVGRLSEIRRQQVVDLLHSMVEQESNSVADVLLEWSGDKLTDTDTLATDIETLIHTYHGVPLKRLNITDILSDLATLLRDHHLSLPPDLTMLFKALITLEGMGRQLDPDFDLASEAAPFLKQVTLDRYKPEVWITKGRRNVVQMVDILSGLPRDLRRLIKAMRTGTLRINIDIIQLEQFGKQVDNAASRLTVGLITASLIIGSSIVMTVKGGPTIMGLPALGLLGFSAAAIGGVWVLLSILKGSRNKNP